MRLIHVKVTDSIERVGGCRIQFGAAGAVSGGFESIFCNLACERVCKIADGGGTRVSVWMDETAKRATR